VRNADVEERLDQAAHAPHALPPALLERIVESVGPVVPPVRPLGPAPVLTAGLFLIVAAVALLGAARVGFQGVEALSFLRRLLIFGALALLAALVAARTVREWIPGSATPVAGSAILALVSGALLVLFALLFHDYSMAQFVSAGLGCLLAGLLHAAVAAPLLWWLLRRGYAVNAVSAGLVAGALAGLAGVSLLELHCTKLEAPHVLLWHTLVVPLSAAIGAGAGWLLRARS
jgi:hypothetical protein